MKPNNKIAKAIFMIAFTAIVFTACQPDEVEDGNGLESPTLNPEFAINAVSVEGRSNTFQFEINQPENVIGVFWDFGDGTWISGRTLTDVMFFPDAGTYNIKAKVVGKGGATFEQEKTLEIETPDPKYGNLITGGKFNDEDEESWEVVSYSGGVTPTFTGSNVVFNYGNWSQAGIYTSFEAEANQKYRIDMTVSGKGASDTWFEVYVSNVDPATVAGDYKEGGIRLALNTWVGCGKTAFADKLTKLSCDGSADGDVNGVIELTEGGTHYLVIRTGGANLGEGGITLDNVEIRPYYEEED